MALKLIGICQHRKCYHNRTCNTLYKMRVLRSDWPMLIEQFQIRSVLPFFAFKSAFCHFIRVASGDDTQLQVNEHVRHLSRTVQWFQKLNQNFNESSEESWNLTSNTHLTSPRTWLKFIVVNFGLCTWELLAFQFLSLEKFYVLNLHVQTTV